MLIFLEVSWSWSTISVSRQLPEARIPHGALLGLEDLGECRTESEIDCQAAAQEDPHIIKTEDFNEQA